MKKILLVAVLALGMFGAAMPAHAVEPILGDTAVGAAAVQATANLPAFPGQGTLTGCGQLSGTLTEAETDVSALPGSAVGAEGFCAGSPSGGVFYSETTCLIGTASGWVTITGETEYYFITYIRVGATAVFVAQRDDSISAPEAGVLGIGEVIVGALAFIPSGVAGCVPPGAPLTVTLVGGGPGFEA